MDDDYFRFIVPPALIPQITGELLSLAADPNLVNVVHGPDGQEIHVPPEIAEAWYALHQSRQTKAEAPVEPQTPVEAPAPTIEPSPPPMSVGPVPPPAPKAKVSKSSALTNDSEDARK